MPAKKTTEKKRNTYKYIFADDYNPVYVNGAIGGVNTSGEIVANFFFERQALPVEQTFEVDNAKGNPENLVEVKPQNFDESTIRFVTNGIIMSYPQAKEIHRWLGTQLENLEGQIREKVEKMNKKK